MPFLNDAVCAQHWFYNSMARGQKSGNYPYTKFVKYAHKIAHLRLMLWEGQVCFTLHIISIINGVRGGGRMVAWKLDYGIVAECYGIDIQIVIPLSSVAAFFCKHPSLRSSLNTIIPRYDHPLPTTLVRSIHGVWSRLTACVAVSHPGVRNCVPALLFFVLFFCVFGVSVPWYSRQIVVPVSLLVPWDSLKGGVEALQDNNHNLSNFLRRKLRRQWIATSHMNQGHCAISLNRIKVCHVVSLDVWLAFLSTLPF